MKKNRYMPLTHELCEQAALEAFNDKWFRRNYLAMAEKYGGVTRAELQTAARVADMGPRLEVVHGVALEMEQRIDDLLDGSANDLDLDPVHTFPRIDGISMKLRQLSDCCPLHQCFGHLAYLGLRPLLRARLLPYQFASIPKKGQTALKRQVERWLRRKSLGIQHALKLDVKGAYEHTKQELVLAILQYEIPRAAWLLAAVRCLLAMSPNGGLLIGGYLEAWMFNLVASYILVRILGYVKTRRGVPVPLVVRSGSYMDDLVLMGRRWADIQSAARKITKWVKDTLHLTIKDSWVRVDFLSPAEEHRRRHLKGAAKGCPGLDMAGYVMHRTYTTVRPGIFKRARRQYMRAGADLKRGHFIPLYRSYRLISYNGYFKGTKSRAAAEALNQQKLFKSAKWAVRAAAIKERSLAVMIITESLDNKPAAVTLEPLPDGTTWLYLRKNAKQVEADTGDETPDAKLWQCETAIGKLGADRSGETADTINAKFDDWWTYAAAWAEDEPLPTVQEQINAIYDTLAVMMGV